MRCSVFCNRFFLLLLSFKLPNKRIISECNAITAELLVLSSRVNFISLPLSAGRVKPVFVQFKSARLFGFVDAIYILQIFASQTKMIQMTRRDTDRRWNLVHRIQFMHAHAWCFQIILLMSNYLFQFWQSLIVSLHMVLTRHRTLQSSMCELTQCEFKRTRTETKSEFFLGRGLFGDHRLSSVWIVNRLRIGKFSDLCQVAIYSLMH